MKVGWDDYFIPNIWKNKIHGPNHQPDFYPVTHSCFDLIPVSSYW